MMNLLVDKLVIILLSIFVLTNDASPCSGTASMLGATTNASAESSADASDALDNDFEDAFDDLIDGAFDDGSGYASANASDDNDFEDAFDDLIDGAFDDGSGYASANASDDNDFEDAFDDASADSDDDFLDYDFENAVDDAFDDEFDDATADASDDSMDNLMPVTKIPETSLFTGLFYKPVMKTYPKGLITWVETGKYYVIVDLTADDRPKFKTGGERQYDHIWTFGATETNKSYTLTNRGKPNGHLISTSAKVGAGKHVAIFDSESDRKKMSEGGLWRKYVSWMVIPTDEENYFKIESSAKTSNFLSWTKTKYNADDYYVELAKDYQEDSKFSFKPKGVKLNGFAFDFKFSKDLSSFIGANESDYSKEHNKNISNPGNTPMKHTLESQVTTKDSITISFKNTLPELSKMSFSINFGLAKIKYSTAAPFNSNEEIHIDVPKITPFKQEITIPPMKMVEAGIFSTWAKNVDLSFTAALKITGTAERMVVGHPDQVGEGPVPSEVVKQMIKSSKLLNILLSGKDVIVGVSGELKGNIGMNLMLGLKTHDNKSE